MDKNIQFLSISSLNKIISDQINILDELEVEGEIFEWKVYNGKTVYLKLKDDKSSIPAMTNIFQLTNWRDFTDGMLVRARVSIKFNQTKGNLHAWVEEMSPHGEGALKIALEKLKTRLQSEGLFSNERKRAIVRYPQQIGLITSKDGAAINDFRKIINARTGGIRIYFYPVKVEGREAIGSILEAFNFFNNFGESLDAIVLIRGGGSLENLQAFNDEKVARCVAASRIPVICGIGHEQDISICDLCADVRASTPSNAAEILVEDRLHTNDVIKGLLNEIKRAIEIKASGISQFVDNKRQSIRNSVKFDFDRKSNFLSGINGILFRFKSQLDNIQQRVDQSVSSIRKDLVHRIQNNKQSLAQSIKFINSVNPRNIMSMGYSVVKDGMNKIIKTSNQLEVNSNLSAFFYRGSIEARVTKREEPNG